MVFNSSSWLIVDQLMKYGHMVANMNMTMVENSLYEWSSLGFGWFESQVAMFLSSWAWVHSVAQSVTQAVEGKAGDPVVLGLSILLGVLVVYMVCDKYCAKSNLHALAVSHKEDMKKERDGKMNRVYNLQVKIFQLEAEISDPVGWSSDASAVKIQSLVNKMVEWKQKELSSLSDYLSSVGGNPKVCVGWRVQRVKRSNDNRRDRYFFSLSGKPFKSKEAVAKYMGLTG